jgi:hypothetical protein
LSILKLESEKKFVAKKESESKSRETKAGLSSKNSEEKKTKTSDVTESKNKKQKLGNLPKTSKGNIGRSGGNEGLH